MKLEENIPMKLEISKERVLEAASKCSTAKETLKTLFPEVFEEEDKYFDFSDVRARFLEGLRLPAGFDDDCIEIRVGGEYRRKGFYLAGHLNWEIKEDRHGQLVLIPTKK